MRPDDFEVESGQEIERGQVVGQIGYTGTSYPHIHFSIKAAVAYDWTLPIRFKRYCLVSPDTGKIQEINDGIPIQEDIIAATPEEAEEPSSPTVSEAANGR